MKESEEFSSNILNDKKTIKAEEIALDREGGVYSEFANKIKELDLEIELINTLIDKKNIEILNVEKLINSHYLNEADDDVFNLNNNQLQSQKKELESEKNIYEKKKEKLENQKFLLIKSN